MRTVFAHPMGFTGQRVKGGNIALGSREIGMFGQKRQKTTEFNAGVPAALDIFIAACGFEIMVDVKYQRAFHCRNIDQTGVWVERHGLPIVTAEWTRQNPFGLIALGPITRVVFNRTTGFHIDMRRPIDRHIRIGTQQFAGFAIQHIKEAVFRRLHDDLAVFAVNLNIGQHHVLYGRIIPSVTGRGLVVPFLTTGVRVQCNDGGQEEVVTATR